MVELTPQEAAVPQRSLHVWDVAHAREGLLVSDDADTRNTTRRLGIPISGTLGILALAVRRQLLTLNQANALLADMIAAGYRSPLEKLDTLV